MMNRMTRILVVAALAASAMSCVADTLSVQIKNAMAGVPTANCEVERSDTQLGGGFVDVGITSNYWAGLLVVSHLDSESLKAGGDSYSPADRNDFYVEEIILNYEGKGVPSIREQVNKSSGLLSAGGELYMGMDLLTVEAADALALAAPDTGLEVDVLIQLRGHFAHGAEYTTDEFRFPLMVINGGAAPRCNVRTQSVVPLDEGALPPCGNWGQDGYYYRCECRTDCGGQCATGTTCNMTTCACDAAAP